MHVGLMVWEIGQLGFLDQFRWAAANGFDAIAFHTDPMLAPRRGVDPEAMTDRDWALVRAAAEPFTGVDIHAPFDEVSLVTPNERVRKSSIDLLEVSLRMAGRLGAQTVTVHAGSTRAGVGAGQRRRLLVESLLELDELAARLGVRVGLEATEDLDIFLEVSFESVGITVDVGHLSFDDGKGYRQWGGLRGLIEHLGETIVHVHVHDFDGQRDHLPLGAGGIDFAEVGRGLKAIDYDGVLCLELAPSPTIEDDYLRGLEFLRSLVR